MKYLIVGLGNIGHEYADTRHNIGFMVADALARETGTSFSNLRLAWYAELGHKGRQLHVIKPTTYMNLSGGAVQELSRFFKIELGDLLIVCDDVNLPLGKLRGRASGSEGGHNGLRSIAEALGSVDYARLRVGVGRGDARRDLADHVTAEFEPDERPGIVTAIARAADAVETWISDGMAKMMNTFNQGPRESFSPHDNA